jgi:hypothetical protein
MLARGSDTRPSGPASSSSSSAAASMGHAPTASNVSPSRIRVTFTMSWLGVALGLGFGVGVRVRTRVRARVGVRVGIRITSCGAQPLLASLRVSRTVAPSVTRIPPYTCCRRMIGAAFGLGLSGATRAAAGSADAIPAAGIPEYSS